MPSRRALICFVRSFRRAPVYSPQRSFSHGLAVAVGVAQIGGGCPGSRDCIMSLANCRRPLGPTSRIMTGKYEFAYGAKALADESSAEIITGDLRPATSMNSPPPTLPAEYAARRWTLGFNASTWCVVQHCGPPLWLEKCMSGLPSPFRSLPTECSVHLEPGSVSFGLDCHAGWNCLA